MERTVTAPAVGAVGVRALRHDGPVFAVTRLRVSQASAAGLPADLDRLLAALAARPGFLGGESGRCADDPGLWALVTRWDGVGSYRRALSAAEVKVAGAPVWLHAVDEPGAFLPLRDSPGDGGA